MRIQNNYIILIGLLLANCNNAKTGTEALVSTPIATDNNQNNYDNNPVSSNTDETKRVLVKTTNTEKEDINWSEIEKNVSLSKKENIENNTEGKNTGEEVVSQKTAIPQKERKSSTIIHQHQNNKKQKSSEKLKNIIEGKNKNDIDNTASGTPFQATTKEERNDQSANNRTTESYSAYKRRKHQEHHQNNNTNINDGNTTTHFINLVVFNDQTIHSGDRVKFRVTKELTINGILIPKGTILFGTANFTEHRINVNVHFNNVMVKGKRLNANRTYVVDSDGLEGISVNGIDIKKVAKEELNNTASGFTSYLGVVGNIVDGTARSIGNAIRNKEEKVTLYNNYKLTLYVITQNQ